MEFVPHTDLGDLHALLRPGVFVLAHASASMGFGYNQLMTLVIPLSFCQQHPRQRLRSCLIRTCLLGLCHCVGCCHPGAIEGCTLVAATLTYWPQSGRYRFAWHTGSFVTTVTMLRHAWHFLLGAGFFPFAHVVVHYSWVVSYPWAKWFEAHKFFKPSLVAVD